MKALRADLLHRLRLLLAQFPYVSRAARLAWEAAGHWLTLWAVLLVVQGCLPVATVFLTRWLVNELVAAVRAGEGPLPVAALLPPAGALVGALMLIEVFRSVSVWVRAALTERVQDHILVLIHRKSVALDLAFYESPDTYDRMHRARLDAGHRPVTLLETLGSLAQNGLTLLGMGAVLLPFGLWLPALLVLCMLPSLVVVLRYGRRQHDLRMRATAEERRAWYYDWVLCSGETAAELRLFGLGPHFQNLFQAARLRLREQRLDMARRQSLAELGAGGVALLGMAGALAWMGRLATLGRVTLGDAALFFQAFQQGMRLLRTLMENVGQLYANSLFLNSLFEFLAMQPRLVSPAAPALLPEAPATGFRFENVTFRYPGSARDALRDFDLTIPAGRMVAIVGENGAGKSTLIKLLCRLYDPTEGRITLDGTDLRAFDVEALRRRFTMLFQFPIRYNASVAANIGLGDVERGPDRQAIQQAAEEAGANRAIERLPKGYETLLGKWFAEGAELSGGEWQRIALARAFLRQAPVLLLDEPTSAMDSWAEAEWVQRFRALAAGRTVVVITHRFTTAMRADIIHVMHEGRIVESGDHGQLLALGGRYAGSWQEQMQAHMSFRAERADNTPRAASRVAPH